MVTVKKPVHRNIHGREAVTWATKYPARTKQEFCDECDINNIMRKYEKTGLISHTANGVARYGDFTNADDYLSATNQVLEAQATFDALPARVRDRMENNPANLIAFLGDENNLDEAVQLGLVVLHPTPPPEPAPAPTPPPEPPSGVQGGE